MTSTGRLPAVSTWIIDPKHTLVEFAARYMSLTTVKGRFSGVSGTIRTAEPDGDLDGSTVEVEIDSASLDSREPQRDAHLRSADFLDVERFPSITFESTRLEAVDADHFTVQGALTIRDVTHDVALKVTRQGRARTPTGLEVAGFTAEAQIDRKDFGLKWNVALEAGGWLVADTVKILLEIQAIRQD